MSKVYAPPILSPARAELIRLMHDVAFGKLEHLLVRDGEPCLEPPLVISDLVMFGREAVNHARHRPQDLPSEITVRQLLAEFDRRGTFEIRELKIVGALPARMWATRGLRA